MEKTKNKGLTRFIKKNKAFLSVVGGVLSGLANGLFGGGGGIIIVPILMFILGYPAKSAHATAILVILPLSIVSGLFYAFFGSLNWTIGLPVAIGVTCGGLIGAFLLSKISSKWLVVIFSIIMIFAGGKMLFF